MALGTYPVKVAQQCIPVRTRGMQGVIPKKVLFAKKSAFIAGLRAIPIRLCFLIQISFGYIESAIDKHQYLRNEVYRKENKMVIINNRSGSNQQRNMNDRIRCDVLEQIGVIGQKNDGWTREVNIVSWNNAPAKVDVRDWDPEHNRMSKGITLLEEEAENLVKVLAGRYGIRLTNYTPVFTPREDGKSAGQAAAPSEDSRGELYESADQDDAPDTPFTAAQYAEAFEDESGAADAAEDEGDAGAESDDEERADAEGGEEA